MSYLFIFYFFFKFITSSYPGQLTPEHEWECCLVFKDKFETNAYISADLLE